MAKMLTQLTFFLNYRKAPGIIFNNPHDNNKKICSKRDKVVGIQFRVVDSFYSFKTFMTKVHIKPSHSFRWWPINTIMTYKLVGLNLRRDLTKYNIYFCASIDDKANYKMQKGYENLNFEFWTWSFFPRISWRFCTSSYFSRSKFSLPFVIWFIIFFYLQKSSL